MYQCPGHFPIVVLVGIKETRKVYVGESFEVWYKDCLKRLDFNINIPYEEIPDEGGTLIVAYYHFQNNPDQAAVYFGRGEFPNMVEVAKLTKPTPLEKIKPVLMFAPIVALPFIPLKK